MKQIQPPNGKNGKPDAIIVLNGNDTFVPAIAKDDPGDAKTPTSFKTYGIGTVVGLLIIFFSAIFWGGRTEAKKSDVTAAQQVFVIQAKEGLTAYVDMATAIDLAERWHIPLYEGKVISPEFRITPEKARQLNTNNVQVTVHTIEGDKFDLTKMTFDKAPNSDFRFK